MALQLSVAARNARLDAFETVTGGTAVLKIRTGAQPANCGAADTGSALATCNLPADWMAAANAGTKGLSGSWTDGSVDASGTPGHFRLYANDASTCHLQGTVSAAGGGGDLIVDSMVWTAGQAFTVSLFTLTDANA